jgi:hypothetical protein
LDLGLEVVACVNTADAVVQNCPAFAETAMAAFEHRSVPLVQSASEKQTFPAEEGDVELRTHDCDPSEEWRLFSLGIVLESYLLLNSMVYWACWSDLCNDPQVRGIHYSVDNVMACYSSILSPSSLQ